MAALPPKMPDPVETARELAASAYATPVVGGAMTRGNSAPSTVAERRAAKEARYPVGFLDFVRWSVLTKRMREEEGLPETLGDLAAKLGKDRTTLGRWRSHPAFMDEFNRARSALMVRALPEVDQALVLSASMPGPKGVGDRTLFYRITGVSGPAGTGSPTKAKAAAPPPALAPAGGSAAVRQVSSDEMEARLRSRIEAAIPPRVARLLPAAERAALVQGVAEAVLASLYSDVDAEAERSALAPPMLELPEDMFSPDEAETFEGDEPSSETDEMEGARPWDDDEYRVVYDAEEDPAVEAEEADGEDPGIQWREIPADEWNAMTPEQQVNAWDPLCDKTGRRGRGKR